MFDKRIVNVSRLERTHLNAIQYLFHSKSYNLLRCGTWAGEIGLELAAAGHFGATAIVGGVRIHRIGYIAADFCAHDDPLCIAKGLATRSKICARFGLSISALDI